MTGKILMTLEIYTGETGDTDDTDVIDDTADEHNADDPTIHTLMIQTILLLMPTAPTILP